MNTPKPTPPVINEAAVIDAIRRIGSAKIPDILIEFGVIDRISEAKADMPEYQIVRDILTRLSELGKVESSGRGRGVTYSLVGVTPTAISAASATGTLLAVFELDKQGHERALGVFTDSDATRFACKLLTDEESEGDITFTFTRSGGDIRVEIKNSSGTRKYRLDELPLNPNL